MTNDQGSSSMKRYSIAIDMLLQSPLHISSMEEGRYLPNEKGSRRIRRTSERVGVPITLTREMEIVLADPIKVGEGEDAFLKTTVRVPVIPANTIGGRLRRCAADLILDSLIARGQTVTARAYNTLCAGSADASMDRADSTMDQVLAGYRHPYFGVFGGTSFALRSSLVVHEGYPITGVTSQLLSIPAMAPHSGHGYELTSVIELTKKDDIMDVKDPARLEAAVGVEAVGNYIEGIQKGRESKAARKGTEDVAGKKTELSTVAAIHVASPGTHFALRFDLEAASPAHLGLLLMSLQRFASEGQIGGKASKGYGRLASVHARLFGYTDGVRDMDGITLWQRDAAGSYVFSDHPVLRSALNAGETFVDDVQAAELEAFAAADANKLLSSRQVRK